MRHLRTTFRRSVLIFAASLLATSGVVVAQGEGPLVVNAGELVTAYRAGSMAADTKYRDKLLQISGSVERVARDMQNRFYVQLKGAQGEMKGVACFFAADAVDAASNLKSGQAVIIVGRCAGMGEMVMLRECRLFQPVIEITAAMLTGAYQENAATADATYKDRQVRVTGVVTSVDRERNDVRAVQLQGAAGKLVVCLIAAASRDDCAGVKKDQQVTLKGTVAGLLPDGRVGLRECTPVGVVRDVVGGGDAPKKPAVVKPIPAGGVTADELAKDYAADEATADARFTGKTFTVSGSIEHVTQDHMKHLTWLELKAAGKGSVKCYLSAAQAKKMDGLEKGKPVKLKGRCEGADKGDVILRECNAE